MRLYGAQSEIGELKKVIIHVPGDEINLLNEKNCKEWLFKEKPNHKLLIKQYENFIELLKSFNIEVYNAKDHEDPNQMFVRDIALVTNKGAIIGNFKVNQRKGEEKYIIRTLNELKVPIIYKIKPPACLEFGDVLFLNERTIAIGLSNRTNYEGVKQLVNFLMKENLIDSYYVIKTRNIPTHLDVALNVISENVIGAYTKVIDKESLKEIKKEYNIIEIPKEDYENLAINWLVIKPSKILLINGRDVNRSTRRLLEKEGIDVIPVEFTELIKGLGGLRCITLPVLRE